MLHAMAQQTNFYRSWEPKIRFDTSMQSTFHHIEKPPEIQPQQATDCFSACWDYTMIAFSMVVEYLDKA